MASLFKGNVTLKNGVDYDVDYEVSASYSGTTHALLNGGTGLDGTVTFKVKSPTYAWTKSVTVGITFNGDDSRKQSVSISLDKDDYTTHTASISVTPSDTYYGSLKFWIENNESKKRATLISYSRTGLSSIGNGVTNYHSGGLCGIYPTTSSPSFTLTGDLFSWNETPGGYFGEEIISLNYYWGSPTLKATIEHFSGYEKSTPSYAIKYRSYKADGTLRSQYLSGNTYSWTIDKNNNYRETIVGSLPLFLREGSEELDYPIREYFLYYNGIRKSESFYVTPLNFNLPDSITAKKLSSGNYEVEVNLGNLNKWVDLIYNKLIFKAQEQTGEIIKTNNTLVGTISTLTEVTPNLLTYGIYNGDIPIISKEINTIFGLQFSASILTCTKSYKTGDFSALQQGEKMDLSVEVTEGSESLSNEEVEITLIVKNSDGQEKEIRTTKENCVQGELKDITFGNITINELIEVNSEKVNKFYLKVASSGTEEIIYLGKDIYAYDYTKSMIINNKIEYTLVSNQDRVNGSCNIKDNSTLEIAFPQEQFKDGLKIKITFYNKNNNSSVSCEFSNSSPQTINTIPLKNLLNNSSKPIAIKLAQKNPIAVPYTVKYIYNNKEHPISEGKEKLIITIPPLLTPTLAYRSKQVGINCEPSEESALDIRADGNFTKVNFQNKDGKETGYIDLQEGGLKDSKGNDFYLTQSAADKNYLTQNTADGIYLKPPENDSYLKSSEANNTYLKKNDADNTYLKKNDADNTYLKKNDASSTYQTKLTSYQVNFLTTTELDSNALNYDTWGYKDLEFSISNTGVPNNAILSGVFMYPRVTDGNIGNASSDITEFTLKSCSIANGTITGTCNVRYYARTTAAYKWKAKVGGILTFLA